jgi:hypothetical protein
VLTELEKWLQSGQLANSDESGVPAFLIEYVKVYGLEIYASLE